MPQGEPRASHRTARLQPIFECDVEPTSAGEYRCSTSERVELGPVRTPQIETNGKTRPCCTLEWRGEEGREQGL